MMPTSAWGYVPTPLHKPLGVVSAHEGLIKGRVPLHVVVHGLTFAQNFLKVARREDDSVVKG